MINHLSRICISMSIGALLLIHTPNIAQAAPRIKSSVTVSTPTLSLADLVDGKNLPNTPLFSAPAPGESGTIRTERIAVALKRAGIELTNLDLIGSVIVTRSGRVIDRAHLMPVMTNALASARGVAASSLIVDGTSLPEQMVTEMESSAPPQIEAVMLDAASNRFTADIRVPDSDRYNTTPLRVSGRYDVFASCPSLIRSLKKGDIISANDVRSDRCRIEGSTELPVKLDAIIGLAAGDDLPVGTRLSLSQLTKPVLVEKGASVTLIYKTGGLVLTLRGRATESGTLGDTVTITHPQSKRSIDAVVTGPGTVSVGMPRPAAVASATLPVQP